MIRFNTPSLGQVTLKFRHELPNITFNRNNDLTAMINSLKLHQGTTQCLMSLDDVGEEWVGQAFTHREDQYDKEVGRQYSLERALEVADLTPSQEREIMVGYYSR